jgi:hypothetical protein
MPLQYSAMAALASFGLGVLFICVFSRWRTVAQFASSFWGVIGGILLGATVWQMALTGETLEFNLSEVIKTITLAIHVDYFSIFFLGLLSVVVVISFIYAAVSRTSRSLVVDGFVHVLFAASALTMMASNIFFLFIAFGLWIAAAVVLVLFGEGGPLRKLPWFFLVAVGGVGVWIVGLLSLALPWQSLYLGALATYASQTSIEVALLASITTFLGGLLLWWSERFFHVPSRLRSLWQAVLLIVVPAFILRSFLFFIPGVSLWFSVVVIASALLLLLGEILFAYQKQRPLNYFQMLFPGLVILLGLFLFSLHGGLAALISVMSIALYFFLPVSILLVLLAPWLDNVYLRIANTVIKGVVGFHLVTLLIPAFVYMLTAIEDRTWRLVMLVVLCSLVALVYLACYLSYPSKRWWVRLAHHQWSFQFQPADILTGLVSAMLLLIAIVPGLLLQHLGVYAASFLGLTGNAIEATWWKYTIGLSSPGDTIQIAFILVMFALCSFLVYGFGLSDKPKGGELSETPPPAVPENATTLH